MNVYDYAHQLANALKQSNEYQTYKELQGKIKANPENNRMVNDFRKRQFEIQGQQMMGQKVEDHKLKELENLHNNMMQNPLISEFIHAEYKLTQIMTDIYKVMGDALELDMAGI